MAKKLILLCPKVQSQGVQTNAKWPKKLKILSFHEMENFPTKCDKVFHKY
jgi:hypothetical protein